ncbi:hypothetical protein KV557_24450 [Kitasatospora aureofaciens]|uniref:hypothetical protein n=1 Tax=Kitasatospora aureofaciens TaxID=1894 RepID=UPI001C44BD42|nr:hypothetical protein [Kitasatospora aureofaciens]MBV6700215.1 hypothetical protein [Kitasatospora aureofaciens]
MTAHQRPEFLARSVFDALQSAGSRGLTFVELMEVTGLTAHQVRHGLSVLREALPGMTGTDAVYTYDPHGHVYRTAYLPDIAEAYELMRLSAEATRSYRVLTGTVLPHARQSRAKQLRMLKRHLQLVVDEAKDILEPA